MAAILCRLFLLYDSDKARSFLEKAIGFPKKKESKTTEKYGIMAKCSFPYFSNKIKCAIIYGNENRNKR